jgi:hypothetical protein
MTLSAFAADTEKSKTDTANNKARVNLIALNLPKFGGLFVATPAEMYY